MMSSSSSDQDASQECNEASRVKGAGPEARTWVPVFLPDEIRILRFMMTGILKRMELDIEKC